jgi:uncharacterized membrane protein
MTGGKRTGSNRTGREGYARRIARWVLGVAYLVAGVAHLVSPDGFLRITPGWVPMPDLVVALTGICEIAGALALLFVVRLRRAAGLALAAYAVCVYPANINHALNNIAIGGAPLGWWYHGPRLALQPFFVWWALWAGGVIDWPVGAQTAGKDRQG